ncbi:MAG: hypothetical protein H7289_13230 [Mucilaginibacter sp.]|nr:hypothetical protein [Mucilaginibacter sp.]
MYLIAKNKIANYIQQYPEAQTNFLVWLKQFPYREGKRSLNDSKEFPAQWNITGESQLGNTHYKIRFRTNLFFKTTYIEWVGTIAEFGVYMENERKKMLALYPDMKVGHVVTMVPLTPPDFNKIVKSRKIKQTDIAVADQPHAPGIVSDRAIDFIFKTTAEYEAGLARAIILFDAGPTTPEGLELATLVTRLIHYEDRFIPFPKLDPLAVIKLKMRERGMVDQYPLDLIKLIGSKEELDQFLTGDKPLTEQALNVFYNYLKINFMSIEV